MVEVLSEGSCQSIERVWARGEEAPFVRQLAADGDGYELIFSGDYKDKLYIREYFKGDGIEGSYVRGLNLSGELPFNNTHKGVNKSWVYIRARGTLEDRFWQGTPQLRYQIKGLRINNNLTKDSVVEYNNNAALVMWWLLQERRGIPLDELNKASFESGYAVCDELVGTVKRYEINGVINASDDMRGLMEELSFCFDGGIVEFDGLHYFRPGVDLTPRLAIEKSDIIDSPVVYPAPAQNKRINAIQCQLQQSRVDDYNPVDVEPVASSDAEILDGEYLVDDIGSMRFMTDATSANRIISNALYQARASLTMNMTVRAGDEFEFLTLMPGDKVTVDLDEFGMQDFEMRVITTECNPNFSVSLNLQEWPPNLYNDDVGVPRTYERSTVVQRVIPRPSSVTAESTIVVLADGTSVVGVLVSWTDVVYRTRLSISNGSQSYNASTLQSQHTFISLDVGVWDITLYHVDRYGRGSSLTNIKHTISLSDIPPPSAPSLSSVSQQGRDLFFILYPADSNDIIGFEARYLSQPLDNTDDLGVIADDTEWDSATQLGEVAVLPARANKPIVARLTIPSTARYALFGRYISRVGKYSDIVELGTFELRVPAVSEHIIQGWADWLGDISGYHYWNWDTNLLLIPEGDRADSTTAAQWRGQGDFPFGNASSSSAAYTTRVIDIGAKTPSEVSADYTLTIPSHWNLPAHPPSSQLNFVIQYKDNLGDAWQSESADRGEVKNLTARYFRFSLTQMRDSESLRALSRVSLSVREVY